MSEVTIVIGTYGDPSWRRLARERAVPSAVEQAPTVPLHGETLAGARNAGLKLVDTPWVIFLDADDELEAGYVDAMLAGSADLRGPAVRYVRDGQPRAAQVPRVAGHAHGCDAGCLRDGNWLCIGTMVRVELLRAVGGFRAWPCYEDWDAFQRCWLAGATVEAIPEAVYRAHVRPDSRNRAPSVAFRNDVHRQIVEANL